MGGKIECLQYLEGVLGGIVPVTHELSMNVATVVGRYLEMAVCVPNRKPGAPLPKSTFVDCMLQEHGGLSRRVAETIFDVACLPSGMGELRLIDYTSAVKAGLIPMAAGSDSEVETKMTYLTSAFNILSEVRARAHMHHHGTLSPHGIILHATAHVSTKPPSCLPTLFLGRRGPHDRGAP